MCLTHEVSTQKSELMLHPPVLSMVESGKLLSPDF